MVERLNTIAIFLLHDYFVKNVPLQIFYGIKLYFCLATYA